MTHRIVAAAGLVLMAGSATAEEPTWTAVWAEVLAAHTRAVPSEVGTTVDYAALQAALQTALQREPAAGRWREILKNLAATPPPSTREGKLALWINAYNVLAIDTVLREYPVDSIRDIGNFFRPVWKHEAGTVAGRAVSLDEIEHEILRPMGEPRIHAAIVCASTSCPSLRRSPFTAAGLEDELNDAMRRWLASPQKGLHIDRDSRRITVSRIFSWFEGDFGGESGVRAMVIRYAPQSDRAWLAENAGGAELDYFDYDWTLNDSTPPGDR
jgi:hypothetical protein